MKQNPVLSKPILALAALATQPTLAFDPLMDEPEPSTTWKVSQEISYTASTTPTWQSASWFGSAWEFSLGDGTVDLDGSMGYLVDDFQLDSAWNLEPKASATWTRDRLSIEGWGWGLWNDRGWTDEGAGSDLSWHLSEPGGSEPKWKTGIHGWISQNSGSAMGLTLSRRTSGEVWSTGVTVAARRLWDVEATVQRPGNTRKTVATANTTDQWQVLIQSNLDRSWKTISTGAGLDIDLRAGDAASPPPQGSMGRGRMTGSASSYQYSGTVDPYADVSWTPGSWAFTLTMGWSTDVQQTKGSIQPTSTLWASFAASKSW